MQPQWLPPPPPPNVLSPPPPLLFLPPLRIIPDGAGKVAQWVKAPAPKTDILCLLPQEPHGEKKAPTPKECFVTAT